jgi:hypothetical protein
MTEPVEGNSSEQVDQGFSPDNTTTESTNPAWEEALSQIPAGLHGQIKPIFSQWDNSYQDLSRKYAPFKEYTPEKVREYQSVYDFIDQNPVEFYKNMGEQLKSRGMLPADVKEAIAEHKAENEEEADYTDPEIKALKAQIEELKGVANKPLEWIQEQEHQRNVATFEQQIVADFNRLGITDPADRVEVIKRAQANDLMGKSPSIEDAYNELQAYATRIRTAPTRSSQSPSIVNPSGGGIPNTAGIEKPKTADERAQYFATMLKVRGE